MTVDYLLTIRCSPGEEGRLDFPAQFEAFRSQVEASVQSGAPLALPPGTQPRWLINMRPPVVKEVTP